MQLEIGSMEVASLLKRIKETAVHLGGYNEFNAFVTHIANNSSQLDVFFALLPYHQVGEGKTRYIFGHFAELHERISGEDKSFLELTEELKNCILTKDDIKIGITRHNFFCLDEIAKFCIDLKKDGKTVPLSSFDVFPTDKIVANFIKYVADITERIKNLGIELVLCDIDLIEILLLIQFQVGRGELSDRQLVRLLGIISENAFIGPQTMVFDPFHRCNIKCKHCFVHNPIIHHQQEFLDRKFNYEMFKSVINDAADLKVDGIILQGDGEPLMYDKFFDMLRYARGKDIGVLFFTNGSLLGEKEAREIVSLGVSEIYCSLPAGTAKTYRQVTTIGTEEIFSTIIKNLKKLMEIKKLSGKRNPRLTMTHVIHTFNHHELIEMAKVDVEISPDASRFYLIRLDDNNKSLKLSDKELEVIKSDLPVAAKIFKDNNIDFVDNIMFQLNHYDNDTGAWSKDIFLKEGCTVGWFFCLIPALYDVSMCCHLRTVGSIAGQSFKELWNSREYRRYRVKAKFLKDNKDFTFRNGVKLYDEHCEHCDNHQTLLTNLENLRKTGLYRFIR